MDSNYVNSIRAAVRLEERTCEESIQVLSEFIDLRHCSLEEVDDGLIQAMRMNCAIRGTRSPKIQAFEIVPNRRNREQFLIEKTQHLLIENDCQHSECDNDGINALFLLFRGFDPEFNLTEAQIERANEELFESIECYLKKHKAPR